MSSILQDIKKALGISQEYTAFDQELIMYINSALMVASQVGVGPDVFQISGDTETWTDFLGTSEDFLSAVKTYVYLKVKLVFDPPANSFVVNSMESQIKELEWRLDVRVEEEKDYG